MFVFIKIWRRWYRKINQKQRRYVMCLVLVVFVFFVFVMVRGYYVDEIFEVLLVVLDGIEFFQKISVVVKFFKLINVYGDVEKCKELKKIRVGKVSLD